MLEIHRFFHCFSSNKSIFDAQVFHFMMLETPPVLHVWCPPFSTFCRWKLPVQRHRQRQAMQLFIRDLQGSSVTLEVEQQQQVRQLKDRESAGRWKGKGDFP